MAHNLDLDVSIDRLLPDAEIPDRRWLGTYWAARAGFHQPPLPALYVYRDRGPGEFYQPRVVGVYVDFAERWVWSTPDIAGKRGTWYLADRPEPILMVRHPLTPAREQQLRDRFAASLARDTYRGIPADVTEVFRRNGWSSSDVHAMARIGWTVETIEDAQALIARPPRWWATGATWWSGPRRSHDQGGPTLPARELGRMVAAGVTPKQFQGLYHALPEPTVDAIIAARPPQIPDAATRIWFPPTDAWDQRYEGTHVWGAQVARDHAARYPETWAAAAVCEVGPVPVHEHYEPSPAGQWVIWSDGKLTYGGLPRPTGVEGEAWREWTAHLTAYAVTDALIDELVRCDNFRALPPVWHGWPDATGVASAEVRRTVRQRPIGVGQTLHHTVSLTRHTVDLPHGAEQVWIVDELFEVVVDWQQLPSTLYAARTCHAIEAEAVAELEHLSQGEQAAYTVDELAPLVGMELDALRQAIYRATKRRAAHRPRKLGDTRLYSLAHARRFLDTRPGHGPGRGRDQ